MRNELLNVFIKVAEEGSFTKAASKLGMSNQLVSKYLSQLETHLNARLLNRTTRKVSLTEAGEKCLQHAKHILESIESLEAQFSELQSSVTGTLSISAPVTFSTLHLSKFIRVFRKKYPEIELNIQLNDRKVDVVEEGFDLALRIGQLQNSSLVAKKIAPVRLTLCASPEYLNAHGTPLHPKELNPKHFLHYSYSNYEKSDNLLLNTLKSISSNKHPTIISNNGELLLASAVAGEGYLLLPTFIASKAIKQGELQVFLEDFEPQPIGLYAVYPHRKLLSSKVRVFIDELSQFFGVHPYWDEF
ncbi:Transcriptional regulator, LysR family [Pseudoalteromonas luteoviolacea B = ATCC 29581]|nr:Transcriptional regulator, LysR family [Pseudoalteromonas luteoviolacea B = ATCC 29581]